MKGTRKGTSVSLPRNMRFSCRLIVITHVYEHEYIDEGINGPCIIDSQSSTIPLGITKNPPPILYGAS